MIFLKQYEENVTQIKRSQFGELRSHLFCGMMVWISLFPVINEHLDHFNNLHSKLHHLCHANSVQRLIVHNEHYSIKTTLVLNPVLKVEFFQVLQAFARAEKKKKPNWKEMFTEVVFTECQSLCPYQLALYFRCTTRSPRTCKSRWVRWRSMWRCTKTNTHSRWPSPFLCRTLYLNLNYSLPRTTSSNAGFLFSW